MTFNNIRSEVELIFEQYRKHKYYTLFINNYSTSVTSSIDEVGGGRSNKTSDKVGDAAVKIADEKSEAERYVRIVESAVDSLPEIEKEIIRLRYMSRNHDYINDYSVYEAQLPMSDKRYRKIRERAFMNLYTMLTPLIY